MVSSAEAGRTSPAVSAAAPVAARYCRRVIPWRGVIGTSLQFVSTGAFTELAEQALLVVEKLDAQRVARTRQRNAYLRFEPAGMRRHDHHAVGEIDGLRHVVGHVDHGLAGLAPHVGEQPLHGVA